MVRRHCASFLIALSLLCLQSVYASDSQGVISSSLKYGWGENTGWINFGPRNDGGYLGLVVTDSDITGYAWSPLFGWINFSPSNSGQGVKNTPEGVLSGSAWVSGMGWLPFDGVRINSRGIFTGIAGTEDSNVGRVSFDCENCVVSTDWRPLSVRESDVKEKQNGSKSNTLNETQTIEGDKNEPQIDIVNSTPDQSDKLRKKDAGRIDVPSGQGRELSVTMPDNKGVLRINVPEGTFKRHVYLAVSFELLTPETSPQAHINAYLINGVVVNIVAKDEKGDLVHYFDRDITITLDIPSTLKQFKNLGMYYLAEDQGRWIVISGAIFEKGRVTFKVNHLTRFAIFGLSQSMEYIPAGIKITTGGLMGEVFTVLLIILFIIVCYFVLRKKLKNRFYR